MTVDHKLTEDPARWRKLAEELAGALEQAEHTFRYYAELHAAKPDMAKAKRNEELADQMAAALAHYQKERER